MLLAAWWMMSCSNDSAEPTNGEEKEKKETIEGGVPVQGAPTDWVVPEETDIYPKSMIVLVDQSGLPTEIADGDLLAGFVDGVCRVVVSPIRGSEGYDRFQLTISVPASTVTDDTPSMQLKYYSDKHKLLFTATPVSYVFESILGEYKNGYKPVWMK